MNNKQKLHQIKLTQRAARFQKQADSGLTIKAWCAENNITIHTYNYWKHKLKLEYIDSMLPAEYDIVALTPELFQTSSLSQTRPDNTSVFCQLHDSHDFHKLPLTLPMAISAYLSVPPFQMRNLWVSLRRCAMLRDADPDYFKGIYIVCGYTDLRFGIDSLAAIIEQKYHKSLFVPNTLFLFCGKSSSRIKGLLWEGDGFLLLYKRVESGHFSWLRSSDELRSMNAEQFRWLMQGFSIDPVIRDVFPSQSA